MAGYANLKFSDVEDICMGNGDHWEKYATKKWQNKKLEKAHFEIEPLRINIISYETNTQVQLISNSAEHVKKIIDKPWEKELFESHHAIYEKNFDNNDLTSAYSLVDIFKQINQELKEENAKPLQSAQRDLLPAPSKHKRKIARLEKKRQAKEIAELSKRSQI